MERPPRLAKELHRRNRSSMLAQHGRLALLLALALVWTSCHHRRPIAVAPSAPSPSPSRRRPRTIPPSPPAPIVQGEEGIASWYGHPFDGRRTSNGEIYDMHAMTAAHRTLPFGTLVRVHDLENGDSVVVRINDRGPFVEGRIIDLSYAAAQMMHMPGTALVRLEILNLGAGAAAGLYAVQVGAFADPRNAEFLRRQIEKRFSPVRLQNFQHGDHALVRVLVGEEKTQSQAERLERQLYKAQLATHAFVVRLN